MPPADRVAARFAASAAADGMPLPATPYVPAVLKRCRTAEVFVLPLQETLTVHANPRDVLNAWHGRAPSKMPAQRRRCSHRSE